MTEPPRRDQDREYIIFCDESDRTGRFFSNFYGGVIVGSSQVEKVSQRLEQRKQELNLHREVKWSKVTEAYLAKYQAFVNAIFAEIAAGHIRMRVMFRANAHVAVGLTREQREAEYYLLYYQFIKHAFGLRFIAPQPGGTRLRLYFDQFPDTQEKAAQFKGYVLGLGASRDFRAAGIVLSKEDITEVRSHDHVLLQALDVILGAMAFRLNDKHKEKPPGQRIRGKRTRAKEALYRTIHTEINRLVPGFNTGVSTGARGNPRAHWEAPYEHWSFVSAASEYSPNLSKRGNKKAGPTGST